MPRKVAAVDGGNVPWFEWAKVACVVPIEQMTTEKFQPADGGKCGFEALDHFDRADPILISRGNR